MRYDNESESTSNKGIILTNKLRVRYSIQPSAPSIQTDFSKSESITDIADDEFAPKNEKRRYQDNLNITPLTCSKQLFPLLPIVINIQ